MDRPVIVVLALLAACGISAALADPPEAPGHRTIHRRSGRVRDQHSCCQPHRVAAGG